MRLSFFIWIFTLCLVLNGCSGSSGWLGEEEKEKRLAGKRISVLAHKKDLSASSTLEGVPINLPLPATNAAWTDQHTTPSQHLSLYKAINSKDKVSAGKGSEYGYQLTSTPIIARNTLFTLDGRGIVSARETQDINRELWVTHINSGTTSREVLGFSLGEKEKEFLGGNIAYDRNTLYVTTGSGEVAALHAKTGKILWKREIGYPIKSAPVIKARKLYFITSDNQTYALHTKDGSTLWTHAGIAQNTTIMGDSSPVIAGNKVIVAYSSGELYALDRNTGKPLWGDSLALQSWRHIGAFSLNDIDATPVISGSTLFAVSHDGVLIAIDLETGKKIWEQSVASIKTPWIAGDFLYILTTNDELVCVHTVGGGIKWVKPLPVTHKGLMDFGSDNSERISWSGPLLAGGKLLLAGSHGRMLVMSPYTGKILDQFSIIENVYLPPIIAHNTLYLLSNDAELMAIR